MELSSPSFPNRRLVLPRASLFHPKFATARHPLKYPRRTPSILFCLPPSTTTVTVPVSPHFGGPTSRRNSLRKKLLHDPQVRQRNFISKTPTSDFQNPGFKFDGSSDSPENLDYCNTVKESDFFFGVGKGNEVESAGAGKMESKKLNESVLSVKLENWIEQYEKDAAFWGVGTDPVFTVFNDSDGNVKRVLVNEDEIVSRSARENIDEVNSKILYAKGLAREMEIKGNVIPRNSSVAKFVILDEERSVVSSIHAVVHRPDFIPLLSGVGGVIFFCSVAIWAIKKRFPFGKKRVRLTRLEKRMLSRKIKSRKERDDLAQGTVEVVKETLVPEVVSTEMPKLDMQELTKNIYEARASRDKLLPGDSSNPQSFEDINVNGEIQSVGAMAREAQKTKSVEQLVESKDTEEKQPESAGSSIGMQVVEEHTEELLSFPSGIQSVDAGETKDMNQAWERTSLDKPDRKQNGCASKVVSGEKTVVQVPKTSSSEFVEDEKVDQAQVRTFLDKPDNNQHGCVSKVVSEEKTVVQAPSTSSSECLEDEDVEQAQVRTSLDKPHSSHNGCVGKVVSEDNTVVQVPSTSSSECLEDEEMGEAQVRTSLDKPHSDQNGCVSKVVSEENTFLQVPSTSILECLEDEKLEKAQVRNFLGKPDGNQNGCVGKVVSEDKTVVQVPSTSSSECLEDEDTGQAQVRNFLDKPDSNLDGCVSKVLSEEKTVVQVPSTSSAKCLEDEDVEQAQVRTSLDKPCSNHNGCITKVASEENTVVQVPSTSSSECLEDEDVEQAQVRNFSDKPDSNHNGCISKVVSEENTVVQVPSTSSCLEDEDVEQAQVRTSLDKQCSNQDGCVSKVVSEENTIVQVPSTSSSECLEDEGMGQAQAQVRTSLDKPYSNHNGCASKVVSEQNTVVQIPSTSSAECLEDEGMRLAQVRTSLDNPQSNQNGCIRKVMSEENRVVQVPSTSSSECLENGQEVFKQESNPPSHNPDSISCMSKNGPVARKTRVIRSVKEARKLLAKKGVKHIQEPQVNGMRKRTTLLRSTGRESVSETSQRVDMDKKGLDNVSLGKTSGSSPSSNGSEDSCPNEKRYVPTKNEDSKKLKEGHGVDEPQKPPDFLNGSSAEYRQPGNKEKWVEKNFHEVEPIIKKIADGFAHNYKVAREKKDQPSDRDSLMMSLGYNDNNSELEWMKDDDLCEIVFQVRENELAGRDPFFMMDAEDREKFFKGLEKQVEIVNNQLAQVHEYLHSNIENLDYGADGISLYDPPDEIIPRWKQPVEKDPEFLNSFLAQRSALLRKKADGSYPVKQDEQKSTESLVQEDAANSSADNALKKNLHDKDPKHSKIVIEGSDGSIRAGKKFGKEHWQHTKKWSRGFFESYNAQIDPEIKSVMKDIGKDLDRWITEEEIKEAADQMKKLPARNKKFIEKKVSKLRREMKLFGPHAVVSKYREYAEDEEPDYLWWLDLPYILCIEVYTSESGAEQIGFYSLEMAKDLELETKPYHVIAFVDAGDCKRLCYIIRAHMDKLGSGHAFVVPRPPKDAFREAKANGFSVTVLRKGELKLHVDQTLEEVEEEIIEIGSKIYHDKLMRERSVDISSVMKGVLGTNGRSTNSKRKRPKPIKKKKQKPTKT